MNGKHCTVPPVCPCVEDLMKELAETKKRLHDYGEECYEYVAENPPDEDR